MKFPASPIQAWGFLGCVMTLGACINSSNSSNDNSGLEGVAFRTGGVQSVSGGGGFPEGLAFSGGGAFGGGSVRFSDIGPASMASELSEGEVMALCAELDARSLLVGNVDRACQLEGWLASSRESECTDLRRSCLQDGYSLQGYELARSCATQPTTLNDCNATVAELVECADLEARFVATRTCEESQLFDAVPECLNEMLVDCRPLYVAERGSSQGENVSTGGVFASGGYMPTAGSFATGGVPAPAAECQGVSSSCFSMFSSFSCASQQGCYWSSSSDSCSGFSWPCSSMYSSFGCSSQQGCYWSYN